MELSCLHPSAPQAQKFFFAFENEKCRFPESFQNGFGRPLLSLFLELANHNGYFSLIMVKINGINIQILNSGEIANLPNYFNFKRYFIFLCTV